MIEHHFGEIRLDVPEAVYEPREDSEMMAEFLASLNQKHKQILEVGCGSGLLSIIMAKTNGVTAVDINQRAVDITKKNAEKNGVKLECFVSDLFEKVKGKYDLIVFNPPYLPDEDMIDGSEIWSNRGTISRFISGIKKFLKPKGEVVLLVSSLTTEKDVIKELEKAGFSVNVAKTMKIPWETLYILEAKIL